MKFKYTYHVSFFHSNGIGSLNVKTKKKIRSDEDIQMIKKNIETSYNFKNAGILNFILLDTKWGFGEWLSAILTVFSTGLLILVTVISLFAWIFG